MIDGEFISGEIFPRYCGQSLRYQFSRSFTNGLFVGLESGIFVHPRNGETRTIVHSYIPVQLTMKLSTLNGRFGFSISTGRPFFLNNEHYQGTSGFWYRDVSKDINSYDDSYEYARERKIDDYYLVSNFRFHFRLSKGKNIGIHAGIQHYWFSDHWYKGGDYVDPYFAGKVTSNHCYNLSLGLSLELRSKKE